jgi:hypothetical protein
VVGGVEGWWVWIVNAETTDRYRWWFDRLVGSRWVVDGEVVEVGNHGGMPWNKERGAVSQLRAVGRHRELRETWCVIDRERDRDLLPTRTNEQAVSSLVSQSHPDNLDIG